MEQQDRVPARGAHFTRRFRQVRSSLRTIAAPFRAQRRATLQAGIAAALILSSLGFIEGARRAADTEPPEPLPEQEARSNAVLDAWDAYVREREIETAAGSFARRFRISSELAARIYAAATAEDIAPEVAFGLVRAESSFRPRVVSSAGAVGLTQVLPSTGRWIVPGTTRSDLLNPDTNLRVGFRYLRYLIDKYDGDERLALTAYNRGPGTVDRQLSQGRNPDNGYVEMVLTGHSSRHSALMNARFGRRRS